MIRLKILFRKLNIKNREGKVKSVAFSILNVCVSDEISKVVQSSLTSGFRVRIEDYSIETYNNEVPSTLYTDLPLHLIEEESGIYLTTSDALININ